MFYRWRRNREIRRKETEFIKLIDQAKVNGQINQIFEYIDEHRWEKVIKPHLDEILTPEILSLRCVRTKKIFEHQLDQIWHDIDFRDKAFYEMTLAHALLEYQNNYDFTPNTEMVRNILKIDKVLLLKDANGKPVIQSILDHVKRLENDEFEYARKMKSDEHDRRFYAGLHERTIKTKTELIEDILKHITKVPNCDRLIAEYLAKYPQAIGHILRDPNLVKKASNDIIINSESVKVLVEDLDTLRRTDQGWQGLSVAHRVAEHPSVLEYLPQMREVLKLRNNNGETVAHVLAKHEGSVNFLVGIPEVLILKNNEGLSVAYVLASHVESVQFLAKMPDVLKLSENTRSMTVAHHLAVRHRESIEFLVTQEKILSLREKEKWTVAHCLAQHSDFGQFIENFPPFVLGLKGGPYNVTVIEHFVRQNKESLNFLLDYPELFKLAIAPDGTTIAHSVISAVETLDWLYPLSDVLRLRNNYGWTVAHEIADKQTGLLVEAYSQRRVGDDILNLRNNDNFSVREVLENRSKADKEIAIRKAEIEAAEAKARKEEAVAEIAESYAAKVRDRKIREETEHTAALEAIRREDESRSTPNLGQTF